MPKRPRSVVDSEESPQVLSQVPSSTIRICVGSYEHVLYGIDALVNSKVDGNLETHFDPVYMFEAHTAQIKACAVGGRFLASGGVDEVIKLYDLKKRQDLGSLLSHDGTITAIAFPPPSPVPVGGGDDAVAGGPTTMTATTHMLSADENNRIIIWRCRDWTPQIQLTTRHGVVNDLSVHPSGKICISVGRDRHVRLWNLVTGKKAAAHKLGKEEPMKVSWSSDGQRYAILFDKGLAVYNMSATSQHRFDAGRSKFHAFSWFRRAAPTSTSNDDHDQEGTAEGLEEHEEELLAASLDDGTIQILDPVKGLVTQTLSGHRARVKALSICRIVVPRRQRGGGSLVDNVVVGATILTSGSTDGCVKVWASVPTHSHGSSTTSGSEDRDSANAGREGAMKEAVKRGDFVEIGTYDCGGARITCLSTCDAAVEDVEGIVQRRMRRVKREEQENNDEEGGSDASVKREEVEPSIRSAAASGEKEDEDEDAEDEQEEEEFSGFE